MPQKAGPKQRPIARDRPLASRVRAPIVAASTGECPLSAFFCALPLIGALLSGCDGPGPLAVGYVEGEYVLLAPIEVAQIITVDVRRGDRVAPGQPLVHLDTSDTDIAIADAEAALAVTERQRSDLLFGERPEEIAVVEAALQSALANAAETARVLKRQADLLARGIAPQADYDVAVTKNLQAEAEVAKFQADLAVARLPARPEAIKAAEAQVDRARAGLLSAQLRAERRTLSIPKAGTVVDIIRNPGEVAGPQAPVLSILPEGAVKLRVYVAETDFARLSIGTRFLVNCDGCGDGMAATVSYISDQPEFTPPVIYSLENRQKLVYLVEARPDPESVALKPGQIIDVDLESARK
jgi:HlyD family secretion protein